ncbi:unnamed protein product [Gongylonema pulchrum]|uniref:Uncharacterized protein n=1 Tax=Gongylonema pulchrum TaxID=637853 RepID=A0A183EWY4_9BILA|nr:unnamed protein product [Gongylonema pulchrum]
MNYEKSEHSFKSNTDLDFAPRLRNLRQQEQRRYPSLIERNFTGLSDDTGGAVAADGGGRALTDDRSAPNSPSPATAFQPSPPNHSTCSYDDPSLLTEHFL